MRSFVELFSATVRRISRAGLSPSRAAAGIVAAALAAVALTAARANDAMFAPAPAAKSAIDFDGKGFLIHGKRTFIASGGMEYARVPRELWRDRLLKMKRAGLNTVELYVFWNYHEAREGKWDFSGNRDLNAYLKLIRQLGLYATVRVGPYVCAEWDSGGYPVWLRTKPGLEVRTDTPQWLAECDEYYEHVLPIVAANQINRGGCVILVQIENEYRGGWGTQGDAYLLHLRQKALSLGIQTPTFFSGMHHASDPAGARPWDSANRASPWMTTEFWTTWYDVYGAVPAARLAAYERATWKILAFGGNGYNYYMFHGGTNFDDFNDNEVASSYDYGAPIGQGGDLRPMYYRFRKIALFARTFQDILENSVNSSDSFANSAGPAVHVYARTSPAGSILFLDNPTRQPIETTLSVDPAGPGRPIAVSVAPGEIAPVVEHYRISPEFMIDAATTRVLWIARNGADVTMVVYGPSGGRGYLAIRSRDALAVSGGAADGIQAPDRAALALQYSPSQTPVLIQAGGERLRLLVLTDDEADHCWPVELANRTYLVRGPDYVGDVALDGGRMTVQAEYRGEPPANIEVDAPDLSRAVLAGASGPAVMPQAPSLAPWRQSTVTEQNRDYDTRSWMQSDEPLQMGSDQDASAYAWYRAWIDAPAAGTYSFDTGAVRDRKILFLDGARLPDASSKGSSTPLALTAGKHLIAVLAVHYGRSKLFDYSGPLASVEVKGMTSPCTLSDRPSFALDRWTHLAPASIKPDETAVPGPDSPDWKAGAVGDDVFSRQPGWCWFQTIIPASASTPGQAAVVRFESVDDNGIIFCNGQRVGEHKGWNDAFSVPLGTAFHAGQENVIRVLVENERGAGGIAGSAALRTVDASEDVHGWRMRGGIGEPASAAGFGPEAPTPLPAFYASSFVSPPSRSGARPILRISLSGMSAGFVWLNGHNLGRYPEKIAVDGLYLPECWIKDGANSLILFDEDGKAPDQVRLSVENAASRYDATYRGSPSK